jgi:hypothetical protein
MGLRSGRESRSQEPALDDASELGRMQDGDAGVPGEVVSVEGENVSDTIHSHRCDEPGIVSLLSRDAMCDNESAPLWIDVIRVRESRNRTFDTSDNSVSLRRTEPESIIFDRPGGNSPQLDEVLRGNADAVSFFTEPRYRITCLAVLRVCAIEPTKDDVGVSENVHYRFQSSSRV